MTHVFDVKRMPGRGDNAPLLLAPVGPDDALRSVGPFALVNHVKFPPIAAGVLPVDADVRPHPHVGLAAITYLVEGAVTHRDSLGNRRELLPGGVGGTVGGSGIVHSERLERLRLLGGGFELFQLLIALPDGHEDCPPAFFYHAPSELPVTSADGASVRWLLPNPPAVPVGLGLPVTAPILLADVTMEAGGRWSVPEVPERAVFVRAGEIDVGGARVVAGQIALLGSGEAVVRASASASVLAFGGTNVGPRFIWWNYVHSSLERIEAAKADWRNGRVKLPDGDTESFTPCPPDDGRPLWRLNAPVTQSTK